MFVVDQKVVYPGHGVARVNRIIEQAIGGQKTTLYELKFLNKDMTILVPINNINTIGVRPVSSDSNLDKMLGYFTQPAKKTVFEINTTNWSKRNKEYQSKIRTGSLEEIFQLYRDLKYIETQKELSFGEKNLLHQTETMLSQEIAIVKDLCEEKALEYLRSVYARGSYYMQQTQ